MSAASDCLKTYQGKKMCWRIKYLGYRIEHVHEDVKSLLRVRIHGIFLHITYDSIVADGISILE